MPQQQAERDHTCSRGILAKTAASTVTDRYSPPCSQSKEPTASTPSSKTPTAQQHESTFQYPSIHSHSLSQWSAHSPASPPASHSTAPHQRQAEPRRTPEQAPSP